MQLRLDQIPLRNENTIIRRMTQGDLPVFHENRCDPELARYQGWSAISIDEAQSFIEDMAQVEALVPGGWIQLAIADHATDRMLGDAGLYVDENQKDAEIGFTLCKHAQGFGHATRAVKSLVTLLFQATAVERIRAVTDARNTESIAVLERAGFHKSREQDSFFKGEACVEFFYVISRADA